jgi:hypothetical protein
VCDFEESHRKKKKKKNSERFRKTRKMKISALLLLFVAVAIGALACVHGQGAPEPDEAKCAICEYAVTIAAQLVQYTDDSDAEIIESLMDGCRLLPKDYSNECEVGIEMYGTQLIALLRNQQDSTTICEASPWCQDD